MLAVRQRMYSDETKEDEGKAKDRNLRDPFAVPVRVCAEDKETRIQQPCQQYGDDFRVGEQFCLPGCRVSQADTRKNGYGKERESDAYLPAHRAVRAFQGRETFKDASEAYVFEVGILDQVRYSERACYCEASVTQERGHNVHGQPRLVNERKRNGWHADGGWRRRKQDGHIWNQKRGQSAH